MRRPGRSNAGRAGVHRRGLLFAVLGLLALTLWPAPAAVGAEASPDPGGTAGGLAPDIIVVMVDDLGYMPDERVLERLPNIRQLWLDGGVRFTGMYDETPLCCPARSNFLTGLHTWHHGITKNNGNRLDVSHTIAVALHDAGYHTLMAGNYLNKVRGVPVPPGWDHALIKRRSEPPSFWLDGRLRSFRRAFVDDVTRRVAVRWVSVAPTDQPLFAWFAPVAPHVCEYRKQQCYLPLVDERDRGAEECRGLRPLRPPSYTTKTNPYEARPMPDWPRGLEDAADLPVPPRRRPDGRRARRGPGRARATSGLRLHVGQRDVVGPEGLHVQEDATRGASPVLRGRSGHRSRRDRRAPVDDRRRADDRGPGGRRTARGRWHELRAAPPRRAVRRARRAARGDASLGRGPLSGLGWPAHAAVALHPLADGSARAVRPPGGSWEQDNLVETEPTRAAEMEARLDELIVDSGGRPPSLPE